jgi:branched-chain amino acid transport system ATP-binding protein
MLDLQGVNVCYGNIQALKNVFLKVPKGAIVTVIGANGAGKSTLLKAISGIIHSKDGAIRYQDTNISHFSPVKIVSLGISQVPEGRQLFAGLSVLDNLHLGAYPYHNRKFKADIEEKLDWVYQVFPVLRRRSRQLAGTLNGGEQHLVAIARALMARPMLLLLDEPTRGLSPLIVEEIFGVIRKGNGRGTTILFAEQNARAALRMADYGYVLETGLIAREGPSRDLLEDEKVRQTWIGNYTRVDRSGFGHSRRLL